MESGEERALAEFELGNPALVCRWRLAGGHLPLENRHVRALLARTVAGKPVAQPLAAWAKQHIEWTLEPGTAEHPDGVLMLVVDERGRAAMTVGPYEAVADAHLAALVARAGRALDESSETGVDPETLWVVRGEAIAYGAGRGPSDAGATSLVVQLAETMGLSVERKTDVRGLLAPNPKPVDEVFLVSDEHGVVPAADADGPVGKRMAEGYGRLLEKLR